MSGPESSQPGETLYAEPSSSVVGQQVGDKVGTFISIKKRIIKTEDGQKHRVEGFKISQDHISVAQFDRFTKETGYKTIAELKEAPFNFRNNTVINDIAERKRLASPARLIAYLDALAFCDWSNTRLPSNEEWLAANVVDFTIYETEEGFDDADHFYLATGKYPLTLGIGFCGEWIADFDPDEQLAYLRTGPKVAIWGPQWTKKEPCKLSSNSQHFDLNTTFRVCKRI